MLYYEVQGTISSGASYLSSEAFVTLRQLQRMGPEVERIEKTSLVRSDMKFRVQLDMPKFDNTIYSPSLHISTGS